MSLLCRSEVKHSSGTVNQDTHETWKSKTQLQSKVGNQGVGFQIHCRGPGSLHNLGPARWAFQVVGFHMEESLCFTWGQGEKTKLYAPRKCLQTVFKYRLQSTSLSSQKA